MRIAAEVAMFHQISLPGTIRVDSSPSGARQFVALATVVVVWGVLGSMPTAGSFRCDDAGPCEIREESAFGRSVTSLGDASRIAGVDAHVHRHRSDGRTRRRTTWELVLKDPERRIVVHGNLGPRIASWWEGGAQIAGQRQPPRVLPVHKTWHTPWLTQALVGLVAVFLTVLQLRVLVRYELVARVAGAATLELTVIRFFFWRTTRTITQPHRIVARCWSGGSWRAWRRRRALWGVWCETAVGAGYWVAGGLSELEAETVVEALTPTGR
jgi:hypothetical protein